MKQELEIELGSEEIAGKLFQDLKKLDPQAVVITNLTARRMLGAADELVILKGTLEVLAAIGTGLLTNYLYDALKGSKRDQTTFTIRVNGVEIECLSAKDIEISLTVERDN